MSVHASQDLAETKIDLETCIEIRLRSHFTTLPKTTKHDLPDMYTPIICIGQGACAITTEKLLPILKADTVLVTCAAFAINP